MGTRASGPAGDGPAAVDGGHRADRAGRWALALAAALVVAALGVHLSRIGWGLDRTDEGQYLLLLDHPEASRTTVFLAGYVLHPLYAVLGGDIAAVRAAGTLGCVLVAAGLGLAVSRAVRADRLGTALTTIVAGGFGLGPTLWFPLTPGYNTLAFWGVCLWASGLALCVAALPRPRPGGTWREVVGPALLGLGGVVAFAGKPTSGAALAALTVAAGVALVAAAQRRPAGDAATPGAERAGSPPTDAATRGRVALMFGAGVVGAAVISLGVLTAVVGHGPAWFIGFYRDGARSVALLEGHERLLRLDPVDPSALVATPFLCAAAAVVLGLIGAGGSGRAGARGRVSGRGRAFARAGAVVAGVAGIVVAACVGATTPMLLVALWWLPALGIVAGWGGGSSPRAAGGSAGGATPWPAGGLGRGSACGPRDGRLGRVVLVVGLAAAPLAYVVGTNGNWWTSQARAAVFWLLAGVVVASGRPVRARVLAAGGAVFLLVATLTSLGYAYRYPAPPRDGSGVSAVVDPAGARLRLTPADATTTATLLSLSRDERLVGVPMIDTTGASPGYIHQLGGVPLGSTWLLGGYPGSAAAALDALRPVPAAEIRRAWVLDAPHSPRRIPGLLPALGRSAERDYDVVATFRSTLGFDVRLLRPKG